MESIRPSYDGVDCSLLVSIEFGRFLYEWWPRLDSNQRPLPCQGSALPTELRDQIEKEDGGE